MFLAAAFQARNDLVGIQQQTHISRPFTKAFLLPGDRGRPRRVAT